MREREKMFDEDKLKSEKRRQRYNNGTRIEIPLSRSLIKAIFRVVVVYCLTRRRLPDCWIVQLAQRRKKIIETLFFTDFFMSSIVERGEGVASALSRYEEFIVSQLLLQ